MVSTSEDDISDLKSYESNASEVDSEEERSDNDLEVMEILAQTESQQHVQLEPQSEMIANDEPDIEAIRSEVKVSSGRFISQNHYFCLMRIRLARATNRYHQQTMALSMELSYKYTHKTQQTPQMNSMTLSKHKVYQMPFRLIHTIL